MLFKFSWPFSAKRHQLNEHYYHHHAGTALKSNLYNVMNSADSLNYSHNEGQDNSQSTTPTGTRKIDTLLQGSENQDSPCSGSVGSISPPKSLVRDVTVTHNSSTPVTMPPHFCQQATAAPLNTHHQILVDPATGQHYLVSSAPPAPQPQIIYQPLYYPAQPAQSVYYHTFAPSAHGPYMIATPSMPSAQSTTSQMASLSRLAPAQQFGSMPPPSAPQSTIGGYTPSLIDADDARSVMTNDEWNSVLSHRMSCREFSQQAKKQNLMTSKSHSPPQSAKFLSSYVEMRDAVESSQHKTSVSQMSRYQCPGNDSSNCDAQNEQDGSRTPVYGLAPAWWGEERVSCEQIQSDAEARKTTTNAIPSHLSPELCTSLSDTEAVRLSYGNRGRPQSAAAKNVVRRPPKSIRMDIDLNEPLIDESSKIEEKTKLMNRPSSSTAFVVAFDGEECAQNANISLQDAAKKGTTRSAPGSGLMSKGAAAKIAGLKADSTHPKQYLLSKMLMGVGEECIGAPEMMGDCQETKPDIDTLSEAGTYVVEDSDRLKQMFVSQRIDDSDDESVSGYSDSSLSQNSGLYISQSSTSRISQVLPQISENVSGLEDTEKSDHLLRGLLHANSTHGVAEKSNTRVAAAIVGPPKMSNTARLPTPGIRTRRPSNNTEQQNQYKSHRLCSLTANNQYRNQMSPNVHTENSSSAFRRADGGRFSMRPKNAVASNVKNEKPPFRVGVNTRSQSTATAKVQKESAEMTAWLRRKDYNPMKAVAEGKKLQQLKTRLKKIAEECNKSDDEADSYMSNRSITFHQGARPLTAVTPTIRNLMKSRHNRSQDDLSLECVGCGPETILASYSKGITRDLNKLRSEDASQNDDEARTSNLETAVKMLTLKCNRSIDLIRNSHHGDLSNSVENLLEMTIKPVKDSNGTVTEQLDRLSAAFDAIQKYLEVSSISVPPSPSGRSPPAENSLLSSPNRPPFSAYRAKLAAVKRSNQPVIDDV